MSKETREHISCLMDGEISREASRFLVRRLGSDEELGSTWARYHVVRDCLRNPDGEFTQHELCSRVRLAIEDESSIQSPRRFSPRWLKPFAGAAIAASVALVAVMAVNPGGAPSVQAPESVAGGPVVEPFSSPRGNSASAVSSRAVSGQKVDAYLLRHYQATGNGNGRTFVGFVPVMVNRQQSSPQEAEPEAGVDNNASNEPPGTR